MRRLALSAAVMLGLPLAGCGAPVTAPSLDVRPIESQPVALPAETSELQVPADPALARRIAELVESARAGDIRFDAARAEAERAVGRAAGAPTESEPWTVAQQSLSALDAARGPVRDAAAAIEALRQDPANGGSGARGAIDAAATRIDPLEDAEAAAVARLVARLS